MISDIIENMNQNDEEKLKDLNLMDELLKGFFKGIFEELEKKTIEWMCHKEKINEG